MGNPQSPADVDKYALEHDLDLAPYEAALEQLRQRGPKMFIDPEPPFAQHVLARLESGMSLEQAVREAEAIAEAHRTD